MKELRLVHSDYETRGGESIAAFPKALRVVRMAFSVGGVLEVPIELYADALNAYERVENDIYAEERRYSATEVGVLALLFDSVRTELDASLDIHGRPHGPGGELLVREALLPSRQDDGKIDDDRVFQLEDDGRIATIYPRMSLPDFRDRLAALVKFLQDAASRDLEVAVLG